MGSVPAYVAIVIWSMICVYLLVDTISGALLGVTGGIAPLSQVWKATVLVLLIFWSSIVSTGLTSALIAMIAVILVGPLARLAISGNSELLLDDLTAAIKTLLPALVLMFCCAQRRTDPGIYSAWANRVLWFGSAIMLLNIGFGLLGFGYTTYGVAESGGIGVTGFFFAGNEVGATYVVLSAFVLLQVWQHARKWYLVVASLIIFAAFLIATKSAILGALVLAFGVPIASIRGRIYKLGWRAAVVLVLAIGALLWGAIEIWIILEVTGLAGRIASVLADRGWVGVLFSGREQFVAQSIRGIWQDDSLSQIVFGPGQARLAFWSGKPSTETDPLDLYFWFGISGLVYCLLLYAYFIFLPWRASRKCANSIAPVVLLTNTLLIVLSIVGGHVVLSGMVGIAWAVLTSLSLGDHATAAARMGYRPTRTGA